MDSRKRRRMALSAAALCSLFWVFFMITPEDIRADVMITPRPVNGFYGREDGGGNNSENENSPYEESTITPFPVLNGGNDGEASGNREGDGTDSFIYNEDSYEDSESDDGNSSESADNDSSGNYYDDAEGDYVEVSRDEGSAREAGDPEEEGTEAERAAARLPSQSAEEKKRQEKIQKEEQEKERRLKEKQEKEQREEEEKQKRAEERKQKTREKRQKREEQENLEREMQKQREEDRALLGRILAETKLDGIGEGEVLDRPAGVTVITAPEGKYPYDRCTAEITWWGFDEQKKELRKKSGDIPLADREDERSGSGIKTGSFYASEEGHYEIRVLYRLAGGMRGIRRIHFALDTGRVFFLEDNYFQSIKGKWLQKVDQDLAVEEYSPEPLAQGSIRTELTRDGSGLGDSGVSFSCRHLDNGWWKYTRKIRCGVFSRDGIYRICFYSSDLAGSAKEEKEVSFNIDSTSPDLLYVKGLDGTKGEEIAEGKNLRRAFVKGNSAGIAIGVFDSMALLSVSVLEGEEVLAEKEFSEQEPEENQYELSFQLERDEGGPVQNIRIRVTDRAGNIYTSDKYRVIWAGAWAKRAGGIALITLAGVILLVLLVKKGFKYAERNRKHAKGHWRHRQIKNSRKKSGKSGNQR